MNVESINEAKPDLIYDYALVNACRLMLSPLARLITRAGMPYAEFEALMREAFVAETAASIRDRDIDTRYAKVANQLGLPDSEVKRRLEDHSQAPKIDKAPLNQPMEVLDAWHTLPAYLDATGRPKDVPFKAPGESFAALVKAVDGDVPAGAILRDLIEANAVEQLANGTLRVLTRKYLAVHSMAQLLHRVGVTLERVIGTLEHNVRCQINNLSSDSRYCERSYNSRHFKVESIPEFNDFVRRLSDQWLVDISDWAKRHESDPTANPSESECEAGFGVYFFVNDLDRFD